MYRNRCLYNMLSEDPFPDKPESESEESSEDEVFEEISGKLDLDF